MLMIKVFIYLQVVTRCLLLFSLIRSRTYYRYTKNQKKKLYIKEGGYIEIIFF